MIQPESVKQVLMRETGAPFEIGMPAPRDPFFGEHPKWFVTCPDSSYVEQTFFARAAWSDANDNLWIGSDIVRTSVGLIEASYGGKRARMLKNANWDFPNLDTEIGEKFPEALNMIKRYESAIKRLSTRLGVDLMLRRSSSDGIVFFTLVSMMGADDANSSTLEQLEGLISRNLKALKEAYGEITTR
jgi:hypothetical protein